MATNLRGDGWRRFGRRWRRDGAGAPPAERGWTSGRPVAGGGGEEVVGLGRAGLEGGGGGCVAAQQPLAEDGRERQRSLGKKELMAMGLNGPQSHDS